MAGGDPHPARPGGGDGERDARLLAAQRMGMDLARDVVTALEGRDGLRQQQVGQVHVLGDPRRALPPVPRGTAGHGGVEPGRARPETEDQSPRRDVVQAGDLLGQVDRVPQVR